MEYKDPLLFAVFAINQAHKQNNMFAKGDGKLVFLTAEVHLGTGS